MKIILDENMPHGLLRVLAPRSVTTVQQAGFAGVRNGALLAALEGAYDVFVTGDKNLCYQQNLAGRQLAIINYQPTAGLRCARSAHRLSKRLISADLQVIP